MLHRLLSVCFSWLTGWGWSSALGPESFRTRRYDAMGRGVSPVSMKPWTEAPTAHTLGPPGHVSTSTTPLTVALFFIHGARDRGVVLPGLEPRRAALQKRLFCEIFSRKGYFMLKYEIKVNFVKIVSHTCA
jgi:hypothetical protein